MNKNDFVNLKFFSSIYLKLQEKKVDHLEVKAMRLKKEIEKEKKLLQQNHEYFDKLLAENALIKKQYDHLMLLFENENKTISIRNNNYRISIWENVFIEKKSAYYIIKSKREEDGIYTFNKDMNGFIDYFLTLDYSIVVLSISKKRINLQIRLNNKLI